MRGYLTFAVLVALLAIAVRWFATHPLVPR